MGLKEKILKLLLAPLVGLGSCWLVTLNNDQEIYVKNARLKLEYLVELHSYDLYGNPIIKTEKQTKVSNKIKLTIPKDLSEEERNHPRYKVLYSTKKENKLYLLEEYQFSINADEVSVVYIGNDYCIVDLKNGDRVQGYIDCFPLQHFDADKWEIVGEDPSSAYYIKNGKQEKLKKFYESNNIGYRITRWDSTATIFIPFSEIQKIEPK
ncbi:MAG: hypothetical protein NZ889_00570 [Candidatus Pacearchaeota archaeon]|nr:hypothetical protein [Candidatus Pacearchaeota archaeon]